MLSKRFFSFFIRVDARIYRKQFFGEVRNKASDQSFNLFQEGRAHSPPKKQSYRWHISWCLGFVIVASSIKLCAEYKNPPFKMGYSWNKTHLSSFRLHDRREVVLSGRIHYTHASLLALLTKWYILLPCLLSLPIPVHTASTFKFGFLSKQNCLF